MKIRGHNQNNTVVTSALKRLDVDGCHSFFGAWRKGVIELLWYRDGSSRKGASTCCVPTNQEGDNWALGVKDVS